LTDDPYRVLGVDAAASAEELAAARRRLARTLHPDVGGDDETMRVVNAAYDEAVARLSAPSPPPGPPTEPPTPTTAGPSVRERRHGGARRDTPSFTIDVLPVDAFEALLVVTSWVGEVLDDEPPYRLEVFVRDPWQCWCRLDLVPDAGATTVSLTVAAPEGSPTPDPEDVRDLWVALLNQLGNHPPDGTS
jgi:DnaJ domain